MVRLDRLGDAVGAARLDHVASRASPARATLTSPSRARLVLEDADELLADDLALRLRVGDPGEPARGSAPAPARGRAARGSAPPNVSTTCSASPLRSRPWSTKTHVSWSPTALCTSSAATAQSTPPERRAEHPLAADLRADALDLLLDHRGGRPGRRRAGDLVEEVLQHLLAVRRVHDLGVELDAVELARGVLERRDGRVLGRGDDRGARRRRDDRVAVGHPGGLLGRQRREERAARRAQLDLAELARVRAVDAAAELERQQLQRRNRCRASGCRARRSPGPSAARRRRRPRRGRRRGSARPGSCAGSPRRVARCETSSE